MSLHLYASSVCYDQNCLECDEHYLVCEECNAGYVMQSNRSCGYNSITVGGTESPPCYPGTGGPATETVACERMLFLPRPCCAAFHDSGSRHSNIVISHIPPECDDENCLACAELSTCTACADGFFLTAKTTCHPGSCPVEQCCGSASSACTSLALLSLPSLLPALTVLAWLYFFFWWCGLMFLGL